MPADGQLSDRLEELYELNRLFLTYLQAQARDGHAARGLDRRVVAQLCEARPAQLEAIAELPTALFRLELDAMRALSDKLAAPSSPLARMQLALVLTILNNARFLARTRPFEARAFLHLSVAELARLRTTPLSRLPALANTPGIVQCAFADMQLTWNALLRPKASDASRMLVLIALQPDIVPPRAAARRGTRPGLSSYG